MIGFSQTNDLPDALIPNVKERTMVSWLDQSTSNKELCDEIDEIMKQEQEDVILLDEALASGTALDLNLDSFSDLLGNPSSLSSSAAVVSPMSPSTGSNAGYTSPRNVYELPPTSCPTYAVNNSQSKSTTGSYSSLGISPKFTTLSIHQHHHHPYSPPAQETNHSSTLFPKFIPSPVSINSKNNLHPPPYVQQQDNTGLGPSYNFDLPMSNGPSDVKRFRSASMNEGATQQQQARIDPHLLDPYRNRSATYVEPSYYQSRALSSTNTTITTTSSASSLSTDISSNGAWPFVGSSRPTSSSFSEVLSQQQQQHQQQQAALRMSNNLSSSFGGSPSLYSLQHLPNQSGFLPDLRFQPQQQPANCTLYSLNQPSAGATAAAGAPLVPPTASSLSRKRPSIVTFPVDEIKVDPTSPCGTIEQHSEADLWSDIEQNSSDLIAENDIDDDDDDDEISSDDETATTISGGFHPDHAGGRSAHFNGNTASPFWQYNVQAKGPKTKRILYLKERDPHLYREFSDPVYQIKLTQTRGQALTKLRKGDGNDVTPNPMKLYQLGKQIRDLSSVAGKSNSNTPSVYHGIYHFDPQTNSNDSAEVKKEKNKIASRACRLRKKAQHEANKLKLHGLNEEHKTLIDLIASIKLMILKRYHEGQLTSPSSSPHQSLDAVFDQLIANKYSHPVAGNTDGFVQGIIADMENLYATKQQRSSSLNV